MGAPRVSKYVLAALENYRGSDVSLQQLMAELRKMGQRKLTEDQVKGSIARLTNMYQQPITVVMRGQVWRYGVGSTNPEPKRVARTFEEIGTTVKGDVLVRDADGVIYTLVPLV